MWKKYAFISNDKNLKFDVIITELILSADLINIIIEIQREIWGHLFAVVIMSS